MKRSTPKLRSEGEIKQKDSKKYDSYIKKPSKINPIFTRKPYSDAK
ncbi:MAG: hypothetical protein ACK5JH_07925 [Anaerocolumna sp.]